MTQLERWIEEGFAREAFDKIFQIPIDYLPGDLIDEMFVLWINHESSLEFYEDWLDEQR